MGLAGCFRVLLFIENFIFWLIGVALVALGSYILLAPELPVFLQILEGSQVICYVALGLGVILFIIGFFGCCGALKENTCLLKTYAGLLIVMVLLEIAAGVLIWQMEEQVVSLLSIGWYTLDDTSRDIVQQQFACCGLNTPGDVADAASCIDRKTGEIFEFGCYDKLKENILGNIIISASIAGGVCFLQIVSIVASCVLGKRDKPTQVRPLRGAKNAWGGYA